jgi:hypothetical protein
VDHQHAGSRDGNLRSGGRAAAGAADGYPHRIRAAAGVGVRASDVEEAGELRIRRDRAGRGAAFPAFEAWLGSLRRCWGPRTPVVVEGTQRSSSSSKLSRPRTGCKRFATGCGLPANQCPSAWKSRSENDILCLLATVPQEGYPRHANPAAAMRRWRRRITARARCPEPDSRWRYVQFLR